MKYILSEEKIDGMKERADELYDRLYGQTKSIQQNKTLITYYLSVARTLLLDLFKPKVFTRSTMANWTMDIVGDIRCYMKEIYKGTKKETKK